MDFALIFFLASWVLSGHGFQRERNVELCMACVLYLGKSLMLMNLDDNYA